MKNEIDIQALIEKLAAGQCNLNELYQLEEYLKGNETSSKLKDKILYELENVELSKVDKKNFNPVFESIRSKMLVKNTEKQGKKLLLTYVKVAAIVIISFILGIVADSYLIQPNTSDNYLPIYSEITAPFGAKSNIVLPDSSIVWLNSGSKIKYSSDFNRKERNVSLEGEAYFKVAKNKNIPFIVNSFGFLVEAVGTEFNIKAYSEEHIIETILVEGKVQLKHAEKSFSEEVFLDPNSKAVFYKHEDSKRESDLVIDKNIDTEPLISWKENKLIFRKEYLKDLAVKLGRKYNYSFVFDDEQVKNFRFSGTLKDETLQQVLDVISITAPIKYRVEDKVVIISKDQGRLREQ